MNISVIGGDNRIVELVKLLKEKNNVGIYALEKSEELLNDYSIQIFDNVSEALVFSDKIILSIPMSKDGIYINTPYSNNKIKIQELLEKANNKQIISGNITKEITKINNNKNEIIDILQSEDLAILNSIPTAEGAIQIAMEKSTKTLHGSNCLVMGFGRIGKILSKMLNGIGANVYCEARKKSDLAWINAYGYNAIDLKDLDCNLSKFDFIFNTIPFIILDKNNLKLINKQCVLIDLASKPGGIDFEEANRIGLQTEWALAIPGKVAPKTSAIYIYNILQNM